MDQLILSNYLNKLVDRLYKILPLYEEKNRGLFRYVQSVIFELEGFRDRYPDIGSMPDFESVMNTLEEISNQSILFSADKKLIKSEVFRIIGIIKKIISLQSGEVK